MSLEKHIITVEKIEGKDNIVVFEKETELFLFSGETSCPICKESYVDDMSVCETWCHHFFCERCFAVHYFNDRTCPICREREPLKVKPVPPPKSIFYKFMFGIYTLSNALLFFLFVFAILSIVNCYISIEVSPQNEPRIDARDSPLHAISHFIYNHCTGNRIQCMDKSKQFEFDLSGNLSDWMTVTRSCQSNHVICETLDVFKSCKVTRECPYLIISGLIMAVCVIAFCSDVIIWLCSCTILYFL